MTIAAFYNDLLLAYAIMSVLVFVVLQWIVKAAYGRHNDGNLAWWWGPGIPTRWSWVMMEAPSSIGFAVIAKDGSISNASIHTGSGHRRLDEAALKVLQDADPVPGIPDDLGRDTLTLVVPVEYSLLSRY